MVETAVERRRAERQGPGDGAQSEGTEEVSGAWRSLRPGELCGRRDLSALGSRLGVPGSGGGQLGSGGGGGGRWSSAGEGEGEAAWGASEGGGTRRAEGMELPGAGEWERSGAPEDGMLGEVEAMQSGARGMTGVNVRRNRLFRRVTRPEASLRTTYWSNWRTSSMMPVLSHWVGWGPVWFWIRTESPTVSGGRCRVCSDKRSAACICRFRKASSRERRVSCQVGWGLYLPGWMGMKSRMGRPKTHIAGDRPVSLSGVLQYWSMARWNPSEFSLPSAVTLPVRRRLAVLSTAVAVGEGNRGDPMSYAPVAEEGGGQVGCEFRSPVRWQFIADADEDTAESSDESVGPISGLFNNRPIAVPVNDDQIVMALKVEIVGSNALERVSWGDGRGAAGWEGAMRLQGEHRDRISVMAGVILGQKMEDSAREHICVTPWCAECKACSTWSRREGGMTTRSRYRATPSKLERRSLNWWYWRSSGGRSLRWSGKPSSMTCSSADMEGSFVVARRTASQVTVLMTSVGGEAVVGSVNSRGADSMEESMR